MIDSSAIQEVLIELEEMKNISKKNIATIEDEIEELKSKKAPVIYTHDLLDKASQQIKEIEEDYLSGPITVNRLFEEVCSMNQTKISFIQQLIDYSTEKIISTCSINLEISALNSQLEKETEKFDFTTKVINKLEEIFDFE